MNPKHLHTLLMQGHRVFAQHKSGQYIIFLFITKDGNFQGTWLGEAVEHCMYIGLDETERTYTEIQNDFTGHYEIVTPEPFVLEKGTKVDCFHNGKWRSGYKIISFTSGSYEILDINNQDGLFLPQRCVAKSEDQIPKQPKEITMDGVIYREVL